MSRIDVISSIAAITLVIFIARVGESEAAGPNEEICNATADTAFGIENYPEAIELHQKVISAHPADALAHYHLGFAYRMVGRDADEINEYLAAVSLGLRKWDLFLNLGLAYLERHELAHAAAALETAASLGSEHAEAHFNLAIVYERQKRLDKALREIAASRRLAPDNLDAENTNAIICMEMENLACAHDIWTHLVQAAPEYAAARVNFAMLGPSCVRKSQSMHEFAKCSCSVSVRGEK